MSPKRGPSRSRSQPNGYDKRSDRPLSRENGEPRDISPRRYEPRDEPRDISPRGSQPRNSVPRENGKVENEQPRDEPVKNPEQEA